MMSNLQSAGARLFLFSLLSLFMELLLIRYMGTEVLLFSYYKNLTLLSAFVGLSLGFLMTGSRRNYFNWSAFAFLALTGILLCAHKLGITFLTFVDPFQYMFFLSNQSHTTVPVLTSLRTLAILMGLFSLSAFCFVGMGQEIGRLFEKMAPLRAYSINVAGAFIGTATFSLLSYLQTPPGVWIAVCGAMFMAVRFKPSEMAVTAFGIVSALWLTPYMTSSLYGPAYEKTVWSPYFRIDLVEEGGEWQGKKVRFGYKVNVSYDTFQVIADCSPANLATLPVEIQEGIKKIYDNPYLVVGRVPEKVLILGAGSGSDAAAALRAGVKQIDAVDIDPAICQLGKDFHPERPYLNPKVRIFNMDARTYLRNCKEKYDLIIFAYLDSHTAFSSLSSLRTDNYIFTNNSYKEAARLLTDKGIIYVSFICFKDWLWDRHGKALAEATGITPQGYSTNNGVVDVGYILSGPGIVGEENAAQLRWPQPKRNIDPNSSVELATDDWPFLFLPKREFSGTYALPLASVLGLCMLIMFKHLKGGVHDRFSWEMLLMGAGFMLLEVRAMADLSLLFGSTWIVNAAVISGVLLFILLGNFVAAKLPANRVIVIFGLLIPSLILSTIVHVADLTAFGETLSKFVGVLIYVFPVTFAAIIFGSIFKSIPRGRTSQALAFNLFGGVIGVSLEYLSMLLGIRALGWIAVAIYCAAAAGWLWISKASKSVGDGGDGLHEVDGVGQTN
jgi:hypothetical protein